MPSTKPKMQLYLDADTEPHLRQWLDNRKFSNDSAALNQLLREFFGIDKPEPIQAFDWRWAINEAIAPLIERIEALETKWIEAEAQSLQERESPQATSLLPEALETCRMQMYVIEQFQKDIAQKEVELLNDSPGDSPLTDREQIDNEIAEVVADAPIEPPDLDECVAKTRAILEAQLGELSQEKLKSYGEGELLQFIYALHNNLYVEEAEEIYNRLLAGIPKNPPLSEILISDSIEEVELNLERDSPEESPGELKEELTHNELAKRLGRQPATLRRQRNQAGFSEWSQQLDPMGLAWQWNSFARVYRGYKIKSV